MATASTSIELRGKFVYLDGKRLSPATADYLGATLVGFAKEAAKRSKKKPTH